MSSTNSVGTFKLEGNETVALGATPPVAQVVTPPAPVAEEIDTSYKSPVKAMLKKIKSAKALANPEPTVKKDDFIVLPYDAFSPKLDLTFYLKFYGLSKALSRLNEAAISHDPKIKFHTRSDTLPTPGIGECERVSLEDLHPFNKTSDLLKNGPGEIDFRRVAIECDPKNNVGFRRQYYIFTACGNYTEELHREMNLSWKSSGVKTVRHFIQWFCNFDPSSCLSTVPSPFMPIDYLKKARAPAPVSENCEPKTLFSQLTEAEILPPVSIMILENVCGIPQNYETFRTEKLFAGADTPLDGPTNFIRQKSHFRILESREHIISIWTNPFCETNDIDFGSRIVGYSPEDPDTLYIQKRDTFLLKSKVTGFSRYTYDQAMHVYFNDQWKSLELNKPKTLSEYKKWTDRTLQKYLSETNSEFST
jgi:hypothetical protein